MNRTRIAFANQLRGLAALSVLTIHYTVVFQLMRPTVAWVVAAPPLEGPVSPLAVWLQPGWFDGGAFGVALFFLISGFVIPFSLAGTTRLRFLAARALRIYPTFWAALLVEWLVIAANGAFWHRPIVFGWGAFLRNALLVNSAWDGVNVDFVSWTLSVEVKFYLLMALLRPAVLHGRVGPLLAAAAAMLVGTVALGGVLPPLLTQEAMYLGYMLIGTLFHFHHRGAIGTAALWSGGTGLLVLSALCWRFGPAAELWPAKPANYGYALALFAAAYAARNRFGRSKVLDALAAISYPLYLVHSLVGFATMSFAIGTGLLGYPAACVAGLLASGTVATLLHLTVERGSVQLGRTLTRPGKAGDVERMSRNKNKTTA